LIYQHRKFKIDSEQTKIFLKSYFLKQKKKTSKKNRYYNKKVKKKWMKKI